MPQYRILGGVLDSELTIPELSPIAAGETGEAGDWSLRVRPLPDWDEAHEVLGEEAIDAEVTVRLLARSETVRLSFSDTGDFEFSPDGREITWSPGAAHTVSAASKDLLGRVMAVALELGGVVTLHGSAVAMDAGAILFLAPKFHGKSTTAMRLVQAGGRLLADDLVAVRRDTGGSWHMLPGVPFVQLWHDSAAIAERAGARLARADGEAKARVSWDGGATPVEPVPLQAVYLLSPQPPDAAPSVRRVRMAGPEAMLALVGQGKLAPLLGGDLRRRSMTRLAALAGAVPVSRLEIARDFSRLDEAAEVIAAWHR